MKRCMGWCALLALGLVAGCAQPADSPAQKAAAPPQSRPNVIIMVLDTLRADYLDLYGFERPSAPFLNRLAGESAVFERAFSSSSCTSPSIASLFTSLYPPQHGLRVGLLYQQGIQARLHFEKTGQELPPPETAYEAAKAQGNRTIYYQTLAKDLESLPEILQRNGYRTFGLTTNINITPALGFDRGFDEFDFESLLPARDVFRSVAQSAQAITAHEPYFLYLHLMDPHVPYHPREPYFTQQDNDRANLREAYLSEVRYMDDYLEKIYEAMDCGENTVLIVLSDHGEEFWDHGGYYHGPTLYRELNRILLMFHAPGLIAAGQRIEPNVSMIDVLPTLLDFIGIDAPEQLEGLSLAPLLRGEDSAELEKQLAERTIFAHRVHGKQLRSYEIWAAIRGDRKLIVDERETKPDELFDLVNDPAELTNLAESEPDTLAELGAELERFRARERRDSTIGETEWDDELEETLGTLGYVH